MAVLDQVRFRRIQSEMNRLYSHFAQASMSVESWQQRNGEIYSAIFNWE